MTGPLAGIRVIELGSNIAGPFTGKLLADMGAEVVKIEQPDIGSPMRHRKFAYDPPDVEDFTYRFLNYNTSKKSVTVDLKSSEGREIFESLVSSADVLFENLRQGALEALGFKWETLRDWNPDLVYCSIKGFGDGPDADQPAVDALVQGFSGVATQVGEGTEPSIVRVYAIDMMTSLYAAWSITMALYHRTQRGGGQRINVTMLDVAVSLLGHQLAEYSGAQQDDSYEATFESTFEPQGYYATEDGYLSIVTPGDTYWEGFCRAIGKDEWAEASHQFGTNDKRVQSRDKLRDAIEAALETRTRDEWMDLFSASDYLILASPVHDIDEVISHPQVQTQSAITERHHPEVGTYFTPNVVPKFSDTPGELSDMPTAGFDTELILDELGYANSEIERLREKDVI